MELTAKRAFLKRLKAQGTMPRPVYRLVVKAVDQVEAPTDIIPRIYDLCVPDNMQDLRKEIDNEWIGVLEAAIYGQSENELEPEDEDDSVADNYDFLEMTGWWLGAMKPAAGYYQCIPEPFVATSMMIDD